MKWEIFWEHFSTAMHTNPQLEKLSYLRDSIKDPKASPLLLRASVTASQYDDLGAILKERYN